MFAGYPRDGDLEPVRESRWSSFSALPEPIMWTVGTTYPL